MARPERKKKDQELLADQEKIKKWTVVFSYNHSKFLYFI